ncbi:MAG: hypothetical protein NTZ67_05365 [Gammaproteobacteria bacterium]|nr:hypothetical protein [Gammaproteobacteria bacterium]
MSRDTELFQSGLCTAPLALHTLYTYFYKNRHVSQVDLRTRVDNILKNNIVKFSEKRPESGEQLEAFMIDLLMQYKAPVECNEPDKMDSFKKALRKNESFRHTFFPLSDSGQRRTLNFIAVNQMHNAYLKYQSFINLDQLCDRAKRFFNLDLSFDSAEPNYVAAIEFNRLKYHYEHQLCFLRCDDGYDQLKSLYTQLLEIIYGEESTDQTGLEFESSKRKINAIFLLSFLIGSNPPMHQDSGGAFVADAMLQILFITAGFPPLRKNFLNLTEIALLVLFSQDSKAAWDIPYHEYNNALKTSEINTLFHPQIKNENEAVEIEKLMLYLGKTQLLLVYNNHFNGFFSEGYLKAFAKLMLILSSRLCIIASDQEKEARIEDAVKLLSENIKNANILYDLLDEWSLPDDQHKLIWDAVKSPEKIKSLIQHSEQFVLLLELQNLNEDQKNLIWTVTTNSPEIMEELSKNNQQLMRLFYLKNLSVEQYDFLWFLIDTPEKIKEFISDADQFHNLCLMMKLHASFDADSDSFYAVNTPTDSEEISDFMSIPDPIEKSGDDQWCFKWSLAIDTPEKIKKLIDDAEQLARLCRMPTLTDDQRTFILAAVINDANDIKKLVKNTEQLNTLLGIRHLNDDQRSLIKRSVLGVASPVNNPPGFFTVIGPVRPETPLLDIKLFNA